MSAKPVDKRRLSRKGKPAAWRVVLDDIKARHITPQRLALFVGLIVGYTLILSSNVVGSPFDWREGQPAPVEVTALRTVTYPDLSATLKAKEAARKAAPRQYTAYDAVPDIDKALSDWFDDVDALAEGREGHVAARDLADRFNLALALVRHGAALSANERQSLRRKVLDIVETVYNSREIHNDMDKAADLLAARKVARDRIDTELPAGDTRELLHALFASEHLLQPNRLYDAAKTQQRGKDAADAVATVQRTVFEGDKIVGKGQPVTRDQLAALRALGLVQDVQDRQGRFAIACLVALVLVVLGSYVRAELPDMYSDLGKLALLNVITMGSLVSFRMLLILKQQVTMLSHPALACGATVGMLVSVLLDYRLAMMLTGTLALFLGFMLPGAALQVAFEAWLAGRLGAMALRQVHSRADLSQAALTVALGCMGISAVMHLPQAGEQIHYTAGRLLGDMGYGLGWGLLSFLVAQGLMPLLERLFGVVTPFRLLELTNTSTPLLQLLKRQARGSFDASLTIGDMAAEAVEAIGGDPLLTRAAGYYHDIGKTRHPTWFVENQFGGANIHDRLEPTVSAMAIKSHVSEGLQLADQYNLPKGVRAGIAEHHGTGRISFFYYQACERAGDPSKVNEEQFRYDGPKPQSRETGVLMLADGVEAAVRAVSAHGPLSEKRVAELVQKIIDQRLNEGQLAECDLTLRDLTLVARSFCEYLRGMYHSRLDYPDPAAARRKTNGGGDAA